ncbi:MAG: SDR family NAD(P)-dependent oxidoreductase [Myxococcales bacterium]|nr:SDR family NAD(P)-dependent oxidoreductase [Myxococcales bacterium]
MSATSPSFESKAVVVTGGGGALGRAVVRALVARGAAVHVPAFDEADAEAAEAAGARVARGVDLTDEAAVEAFYSHVGEGLWASVHVAGGFVWGPIGEASLADLQRMLAMNVTTAWLCCRAASRHMSGGGRLVNVTAKPALVPTADLAAYAASKGAVATLTLALAEELAPRDIWVNAIAPSILDTPANRGAMPDADFARWPKVEDVAQTVVFLASPENATSRGAIVPVYGRS